MKRILAFILIIFITSLEIYPFGWPLGIGYEPQEIISTFGEFRNTGGNHIHDGVDIKRYGGVGTVWGVEYETYWERGNTEVRTDFHNFSHVVDINTDLEQDDPVDPYTEIAGGYDMEEWKHLHFVSHKYRKPAQDSANNPLDPDFVEAWRLEPLYTDVNDPVIQEIFVTQNGNYSQVLDPGDLPEGTNVDIIVKAEERTTNPQGVDYYNGVHRVLLDIDGYGWQTVFEFDAWTDDWDVDYVYDASPGRSNNSNFYYVVTNGEWYDDYWYTGEGGSWHTIHVKVEDEQGNDDEDSLEVYVFSSGVDEEKPDKFDLFVKNLNAPSQATEISYSLPKKSKVYLNIYDSMGRLVNTLVNKEQKAGIYTVKWNEKNKLNKFLPNGIYFCNLRAGDFEANEKIVLLSH